MKTRVLTAIGIILVVAAPLLLGGIWLQLLIALVVIGGSYEWVHSLDGFKTWGWFVVPLMFIWVLGQNFIPPQAMLSWWAAGTALFFALPVFCKSFSVQEAFFSIAFMVLASMVNLSLQQMMLMNYQYIWTIVLATYGSDTGAYFAGRFLGKHKMIERVSPKKTWEGFFGGWIVGFLLSWAISFFYVNGLNPTLNFVICLLAPVFAELGDLCFSSYKRYVHLKDFSNLLPGHGGILDRVDSLLMNILLFGILIGIL